MIEKKLRDYDNLVAERDHLAAVAKDREGAALIVQSLQESNQLKFDDNDQPSLA